MKNDIKFESYKFKVKNYKMLKKIFIISVILNFVFLSIAVYLLGTKNC